MSLACEVCIDVGISTYSVGLNRILCSVYINCLSVRFYLEKIQSFAISSCINRSSVNAVSLYRAALYHCFCSLDTAICCNDTIIKLNSCLCSIYAYRSTCQQSSCACDSKRACSADVYTVAACGFQYVVSFKGNSYIAAVCCESNSARYYINSVKSKIGINACVYHDNIIGRSDCVCDCHCRGSQYSKRTVYGIFVIKTVCTSCYSQITAYYNELCTVICVLIIYVGQYVAVSDLYGMRLRRKIYIHIGIAGTMLLRQEFLAIYYNSIVIRIFKCEEVNHSVRIDRRRRYCSCLYRTALYHDLSVADNAIRSN